MGRSGSSRHVISCGYTRACSLNDQGASLERYKTSLRSSEMGKVSIGRRLWSQLEPPPWLTEASHATPIPRLPTGEHGRSRHAMEFLGSTRLRYAAASLGSGSGRGVSWERVANAIHAGMSTRSVPGFLPEFNSKKTRSRLEATPARCAWRIAAHRSGSVNESVGESG